MTVTKRIVYFIIGLVMIAAAVVFFIYPEQGCLMIIGIITLSLLIYAIRKIWYYFTLARFMVGGKAVLFKGIIAFDLGLFTTTLADIDQSFIMLYLIGCNIFSGAIDIVRANEARKLGSTSWRTKLVSGAVNIIFSGACVMYLHSQRMFVLIYCIGLVYSGIIRIVTACRKTSIVYIQ